MNTKTKSNPTETCDSIKLGIDAHAKWYYLGRQADGATPQPVQKMTAPLQPRPKGGSSAQGSEGLKKEFPSSNCAEFTVTCSLTSFLERH